MKNRLHSFIRLAAVTAPAIPDGKPARPCWRPSLLILGVILAFAHRAPAQQLQGSVDYFGVRQFNTTWALEINPGTSFLLHKEGWNDYYLGATAMFTPLNWFEVDGGIEGHWTVDPIQENSLEIRPNLATIFTWATYGEYLNLFYPAVMLKFEERYIFYQETGTSQTLSRLRLSVMARFPLNSPILDPGTWYLRFKAEGFYDLNGEARVRYASKRRLDAGIGHVLSPSLRLEFSLIVYTLRDHAEETYHKGDLVFWFDVRHFF